MSQQEQNQKRGFTLLELMVSMALGLIVMGAMASLFRTGIQSTMLVTQRAETQENMRAALDLMSKDVSLAGAGLPSGGIQLPTGTGNNGLSKYGCDQTGACHVVSYDYPNTPNNNYMYGIIPGYKNGVESNAVIPAAPATFSDSVTVIYCDYNFPLFEYNMYFSSATSGANVSVVANPIYTPAPPALNAAGGIQVGDLIMITGGGLTAVGEVTTLTATTLTFANNDALNINQDGAASGNLKAIATTVGTGTAVTAYRLFAVTYYLNLPTVAGQTPRLMRQVNGLLPTPVADDIINLQVTYDIYNSTTDALDANQVNPMGNSESPNNIQKINLVVMGESILSGGNKSQSMYLATDVSARNMAFRNRYK
jgi:prepilin-type N-terminal cleavage/methylation domain-containing protein